MKKNLVRFLLWMLVLVMSLTSFTGEPGPVGAQGAKGDQGEFRITKRICKNSQILLHFEIS